MPHADDSAERSHEKNPPRHPAQLQATAASAEELQRRRQKIHSGLQRSFYAVMGASVMVGLLAIAAVWLSREAQHRAGEAQVARQRAETSEHEARMASIRLWEFSSTAAALQRQTHHEGQRTESLKIIAEAARLRPSRQLRDEALSAMLLPDVGTNLVWHQESGYEIATAYDADFEHFIQNNDRGRAIVRLATNGALLMDEQGFGRGTPFGQFSPDGRLVALGFYEGPVGVWDWRQKKLIGRFPTIVNPGHGEPTFDFSPDGQHLWVLASDASLRQYAFQSEQPLTSIALGHPPRLVRLSPSGKFAAVAGGKDLEVWELSTRMLRATLGLTNDIWRLAWHPGEERLAIGCYGGLYLWEVGAPAAATLREDHDAFTVLFFNADGDLLFVAGWNHAAQVWSLSHPHVVLECSAANPAELSRDQTRLSVAHGRVGYGIRQYLAPVGLRDWPPPPSLSEVQGGADLDPHERWVLTGDSHCWLLRDADSGKVLVRAVCNLAGHASFSSDGSNVLAWTGEGLARWPLVVQNDGTVALLPKRIFASAVPREWNASPFSADRRYTACLITGAVAVVNTDDPSQRVTIPLRRPRDSSIYLSPDGRWLITGYHNQHGLDLYDTRAGKFIRTIAEEGFAGPVFDPHNGALFTVTATNYTKWNLTTGEREPSVPWRVPFAYQNFLGFATNSRLALVKANPNAFHLYDLQTGRDFATLDFRDPQAVFKCCWSRDGQRLFLFGNDGGVTRLDLAALRRELGALGLDWADDAPSRDFPARESPATGITNVASLATAHAEAGWFSGPERRAWIIWAGLVATIGIGLYVLRYQRRLFAGYLETEALATRRQNELQQTQAALLHSEKMKALGTFSAGIAHDFNNLLSVIRLSNELIEEEIQPEGVTRENFEAIHQAIQRGRGIVNSMLGYARDDGQLRQFTAAELISEAVALLGKSFLGGLVLLVEVKPDTPPLFARKGRVEQILFNLIVNATEAMRGQGTLTLRAGPASAPGNCLLLPAPAPAFVELIVQDSGPGIPPEVLPRIFDPFFTTKKAGSSRGTGLGLSMLYTMAREDGIGVAVATEPGRGTSFRLLLPLPAENPSLTPDRVTGHNSPVAPPAKIINRESL